MGMPWQIAGLGTGTAAAPRPRPGDGIRRLRAGIDATGLAGTRLGDAHEVLLTWLAAFGGPHGTLGGAPWMLQLPGILLVLVVPGPGGFVWRVAGMVVVQTVLWNGPIAAWRRRRQRTDLAV
jgi:hypothetical protein